MKRIIRNRPLTPEEVRKYDLIREKVVKEFPQTCRINHFDVDTNEICPRCWKVIRRDALGREIDAPEGTRNEG